MNRMIKSFLSSFLRLTCRAPGCGEERVTLRLMVLVADEVMNDENVAGPGWDKRPFHTAVRFYRL